MFPRSGAVELSDISIKDCEADDVIKISQCGGPSSNVTISSAEIIRNRALNGKGVIRVSSDCNMVLHDVRFAKNSGQAVALQRKANAMMTNCQFKKNGFPGTILLENDTVFSANNCSFIENVSNESGAALNAMVSIPGHINNIDFGW